MRIRRLGLNLKRYTTSTLRYLASLDEYRANKKQILKAIPKRKIEKQWWDIRAKFNYRVSKREFAEYYELVRKAQRKLNRIKADEDLLWRNRVPLSVSGFQSVAQFKAQFRRVKNILRRDYKKQVSYEIRDRLYSNLRYQFGDNAETDQLIEEFKNMTDTEFNEFFKRNRELDRLRYDSDQEKLRQYLTAGEIDYEHIQDSIEEYAKWSGLKENILVNKVEIL